MVRMPLMMVGIFGTIGGLGLYALPAGRAGHAAVRVERPAAPADRSAPDGALRPRTVHRGPSGHLRADFYAEPDRLPAGPLELRFDVRSMGGPGCEVSVSPYVRRERDPRHLAGFASAAALRLHVPAGTPQYRGAVTVSPCMERRELGRLRVYVEPIGECDVVPESVRLVAAGLPARS